MQRDVPHEVSKNTREILHHRFHFFLSQNRKLPLTFLQRIISFFFFSFSLLLKYESQIWNWFSNFFILFPLYSQRGFLSQDKNVGIGFESFPFQLQCPGIQSPVTEALSEAGAMGALQTHPQYLQQCFFVKSGQCCPSPWPVPGFQHS